MKIKLLSIVICFLFLFNGANLKLKWDHSTSPDVAGYKIHIGNESGSYYIIDDVGYDTLTELSGLNDPSKEWFIAMTAYDSAGNESGYSEEVTINVKNLCRIDTIFYEDSKVQLCIEKIWYCNHKIIGYFDSLTVTDFVYAENDTCIEFELPVIDGWKTYHIRNLVLDSSSKHARIMDAQIDVPMTGDFDNDGDIDITDMIKFNNSYGYTSFDVQYRLSSDMNRDGKITVEDMINFNKKYGSRKND